MIELKNISKVYQMGDQTIKALDAVNLTINDGEYIAIIGPSGSGKSTLMNVLGCLDNPSAGQYLLNGKDISKLRDDQLADARNKNIGFVFQRFNLMGRMSAMRNVEMPARYGGQSTKQRRQHASDALTAVGLADRMNHKPVELSGGQQQRVAIARALVNQPNILLADEPTGALDTKTGRDILDLFERLHRERGITVIVVTHDPVVARRANRVVSIRDGSIESDLSNERHALIHTAYEAEAVVATPAAATKMAVPVAVAAAVAANGKPAEATLDGNAATLSAATAEDAVPMQASPMESTPALEEKKKMETPVIAAPPQQSAGPIWKRGVIAVVIATIVNVALGVLAGVLFPVASRLPFFSPLVIGGVTFVIGLIATAIYVLINRASSKPAKVFRVVAAGALVLSLVPGVVLLTNPRMMFQFAGNAQRRGQFANGQAGTGQFNNGAAGGGQFTGGQGGTTNGQGNRNFQNRGVQGAGPLGSLFGGNTAGTEQRANNGLLTTLPIIVLMLMPLLSFFIIVPALTRKPRNAAPQLNASGLT
jgi:putative ABC transport system ATP-binding protein